MTQALLNNLNMTKTTIDYSDNSNMDEQTLQKETIDFAKILEIKTDQSIKESESNDEISLNNNTKSELINNSNIITDLINSDSSELIEDLACTIIKANNETMIDLTVIKNTYTEPTDTEDNQNDSAEILSDNQNNENIQANQEIIDLNEITITNEDPTMLNELNTLNDPTTIILMQSQVQNNSIKSITDENEISLSQEKYNTNITEKNSLNSEQNTLNQFDNLKQKCAIPESVFSKDKSSQQETSKGSARIDEKMVKELDLKVVTENSAEQDNTNFMQNQTPQEQAARVLIQGNIKTESLTFNAVQNTQLKPTTIPSEKIIEQISKQLENMHNNSKLNLVLNPGSLGKVSLQIINAKDGFTAQFTVTTNDAKELLLKGLDGLKESLLTQGINVDNVSVKMEDSSGENQSDWTEQDDSSGGNKKQDSKKQQNKEEKPFEQMMFELEKDDTLLEKE